MDGMSRLNALRAVEAVARTRSLIRAARELNVTAAAVGQHVRSLETFVGMPLFLRSKTGDLRLEPCAALHAVVPELSAALAQLGGVLSSLRRAREQNHLTVTVSQAVAAKFLLPRIDDFRAQHPEIVLCIDVTNDLVRFDEGGADVGIRFGTGDWPGVDSFLLGREIAFPVCSPGFLAEHRVTTPADLLHHRLIHDATLGSKGANLPVWKDWFAAMGVHNPRIEKSLEINASAAVLQAAASGQGIALARGLLVADELAAGTLVRPLPDHNLPLTRSWFLVTRQGSKATRAMEAFRTFVTHSADWAETNR